MKTHPSSSSVVACVAFVNNHPEMRRIKAKREQANDATSRHKLPHIILKDCRGHAILPRKLNHWIHTVFRLMDRETKLERRLRKQFWTLRGVQLWTLQGGPARVLASLPPKAPHEILIPIFHHPDVRRMQRRAKRDFLAFYARKGIRYYTKASDGSTWAHALPPRSIR